jgi:hypothetical protein
MTYAARHRADQDLAWAGLVDLDFFDGERLFECTKNRSFHCSIILLRRWFRLAETLL